VRVGLIIYGGLETVSGGYLYDRMLVRHLEARGDRVEVVSLPWRGFRAHLLDNTSVALFRRLVETPFDLLLQDELNHPSLVWLNRRLRDRVGYPLVSIVHHLRCCEDRPSWQNHLARFVEQRYLRSVDGFVFNSQATRRVVEGLTGEQRPSIVAQPAGDRLCPRVTTEQIRARAEAPGPLRLVFVGNLIPRKGLHTLLSALEQVARSSWRLTVIGSRDRDPVYADNIRRRVEQAGLKEQITLRGSVPDAELAACLAKSQVLVGPSSYEGFGIVYLEGMGFGLPCIASKAGGGKEVVTHGQDGYLVAGSDSTGLAEHITRLHQDRAQLLAMSLAARQRYQRHPTWSAATHRIGEFLREIHRQRGGLDGPPARAATDGDPRQHRRVDPLVSAD
jgi:glycosyltransferase involved in cell wall biosynthesis